MTLISYMASGGKLLTDSKGIFDMGKFNKLILSRYGFRDIRADIDRTQIEDIGQTVLDTNEDFLRGLFSTALSPFSTWGESGSNSGENATSGTDSSTAVATNKTDLSASSTASVNTSVFAYDVQSTATPTETNGSQSSSTQTTEGESGTETETTRHTSGTNSGAYSKKGYNLNDYDKANTVSVKLKNAYNILIVLITQEILELIPTRVL